MQIDINKLADALWYKGWYAISIRLVYPEFNSNETLKTLSSMDVDTMTKFLSEYLYEHIDCSKEEIRKMVEDCCV